MQELVRRLTELAVEDGKAGFNPWRVEVEPDLLIVSATTRDGYPDVEAAWEGARRLWQSIQDLGYELTHEGESTLGTIRRLDLDSAEPQWRGSVRVILKPI